MAYREIGMWEIHEVLRRVARGEPQRAIQRATGHSRSTIRRWLRVARELGWKAQVSFESGIKTTAEWFCQKWGSPMRSEVL